MADHQQQPPSEQQRYEQLTRLDRMAGGLRRGVGAIGRGAGAVGRGTGRSARAARSAGRRGSAAGSPVVARLVASPVGRALRPVLGAVSPLGWAVLALAGAAWIGGWLLAWTELFVVASALLIILVLCALLTLGRTRITVRVELQPRRVVAGTPAAGRLIATNVSRARLLPVLVELPIGVSRGQFPLRRLRYGEVQEEIFSLATSRRGVVPVGPATTVRGDPFGLVRRTVPWSEVIELVVHPVTVGIESLGAGVLRDLEGQTTQETSTSDLAFHTLREYAPGDDFRYIHWRSSARASAASGESTLLVRQFLDTRRSHLTAVIDGRSASYLDDVDFEIAISAAASVVRRAYLDDVDSSLLAADRSLFSGTLPLALDTFSRAETGGDVRLSTMAATAARMAPDTTVALLVTGARTPFTELQSAASHFSPEVNVVAIRVDPTTGAGVTGLTSLVVLTLPELSGLRSLLVGAAQ